jgi:hypothetical protein
MQVAIAPASDEIGCPPTGHRVYQGAREDGTRTLCVCRGHTPEIHRSVLLAAPRPGKSLQITRGHSTPRAGAPSSRTRTLLLVWFLSITVFKFPVMRAEDFLEGRRQIFQQMKSVSNLGGIGSSLPHPGSIGFRSVACHHFHLRTIVPYRCPLRQAYASIPITSGSGPFGRDRRRPWRSTVLRLTGAP